MPSILCSCARASLSGTGSKVRPFREAPCIVSKILKTTPSLGILFVGTQFSGHWVTNKVPVGPGICINRGEGRKWYHAITATRRALGSEYLGGWLGVWSSGGRAFLNGILWKQACRGLQADPSLWATRIKPGSMKASGWSILNEEKPVKQSTWTEANHPEISFQRSQTRYVTSLTTFPMVVMVPSQTGSRGHRRGDFL